MCAMLHSAHAGKPLSFSLPSWTTVRFEQAAAPRGGPAFLELFCRVRRQLLDGRVVLFLRVRLVQYDRIERTERADPCGAL